MSDESAPPRSFRRRGLGRGLEALLTNEAEAEEGSPLVNVDPHTVAPNPEQPRRAFEPEALAALGDSIRLHGLLHPIVVQRDGDAYRLVAGERRLRAAQLAGVSSIPAIVRPAAESEPPVSSRWRSPRTWCAPISTRWRRRLRTPASLTPSA